MKFIYHERSSEADGNANSAPFVYVGARLVATTSSVDEVKGQREYAAGARNLHTLPEIRCP